MCACGHDLSWCSHPEHPACPARSATQVLVPVHDRPVEQAAEADAEALEMWMRCCNHLQSENFFIPYLEFRWNIIELMWLVFKLEWLENMSQSAHCFGCDERDIPSDRISSDLRRISAREGKIAGWQWTPKQYRIWMHSCSPSSGRVWKNPMTLARM
jgi:hypothetical protein